MRCPKCNSDQVLVGNSKKKNICTDCDHKWEAENQDMNKHESVIIKSPQVLLSLHYNLKRNKFSMRLDEALSRV